MPRSCEFSLPVSVVSTAIVYIYFSTLFVFIDRWLGLWSSPGMLNAVVFSAVALMCVYNYALAVFTDPGRVPRTFVPDVEDADNPIHEIKRKGGDLRYCQKCSQYKPPRAHHCRVCKRCVLRMVISGLLLVPLSLALSYLLGWHIYLILQNKTTIEYYEGVRAMWLAEKGGDVYSHLYDLGAYENLISVLEPNIFCWLCPTSGHVGSGLRFRTIYDKFAGTPTSK